MNIESVAVSFRVMFAMLGFLEGCREIGSGIGAPVRTSFWSHRSCASFERIGNADFFSRQSYGRTGAQDWS